RRIRRVQLRRIACRKLNAAQHSPVERKMLGHLAVRIEIPDERQVANARHNTVLRIGTICAVNDRQIELHTELAVHGIARKQLRERAINVLTLARHFVAISLHSPKLSELLGYTPEESPPASSTPCLRGKLCLRATGSAPQLVCLLRIAWT